MNAKKKAHQKALKNQVAQKQHDSDKLDQALKDSFPSSDPIQLTETAASDAKTRPEEEEHAQPSAP